MYLAEVEGKGGINAKLVAYSVSPGGKNIATFELTYHRYIHGEFMTHRLFSRNAMSSRAVPIKKMIEIVKSKPATPIHWGKNQPGMKAETVLNKFRKKAAQKVWELGASLACKVAEAMDRIGAHKQISNRLVEPFQMMKTVMTATELDNFFWLRLDADAQPEIYELARCMKECLDKSEPEILYPGQWHTPYVNHYQMKDHTLGYGLEEKGGEPKIISLEEALAISSSCCAQVSYRNLDNTYDKAMAIYGRLLSGAKVHASPFEHQATPIEDLDRTLDSYTPCDFWPKGVTHMDRKGNFWSGNLMGWVQHRQLIPGNVVNSV